MTKARTRAAKRRVKQKNREAKTVRQMQQGWHGEKREAKPQEDPRSVVRAARKRLTGIEDVDRAMMGEPAGQAICIAIADPERAAALWKTFDALDRADETYFRRVICRPRFPNASKLEMTPERFETRDDDRPDLRSADEKDRDAVNVWMRWQGFLGHLHATEHTAIMNAVRQRATLHRAGRLTRNGIAFVAALERLDEVANRR